MLLISSRSDPKDEASFAGLVYFVDNHISFGELFCQAVASGSGREKRLPIRNIFRNRFDPVKLIEESGVLAAWPFNNTVGNINNNRRKELIYT